MTKKHFEAIARILSVQNDRDAAGHTARDLARYFSTQNPAFDTARFLKACGVES